MDFLCEHQFNIKYKPGANNKAANFLSPVGCSESVLKDKDKGDITVHGSDEKEDLNSRLMIIGQFLIHGTNENVDVEKHRAMKRRQ